MRPQIYEEEAPTSVESGAGATDETSVAPLVVGLALGGVLLAVAYMARDKAFLHGEEPEDATRQSKAANARRNFEAFFDKKGAAQASYDKIARNERQMVARRNVELTFLDGRAATKDAMRAEIERQALERPPPGTIERSAEALAQTRGASALRTWAAHDELDRQDQEYRRRGGDPARKIPTLGQMPVVGDGVNPYVHPRVEVVAAPPRLKSPRTLLQQIRESKGPK